MRRVKWLVNGAAAKGVGAVRKAATTSTAAAVTVAKVAFSVATCPVRACCGHGGSSPNAPNAVGPLGGDNGAHMLRET